MYCFMSDTHLMPVFEQLFVCKSEAWVLEECVPFVEMLALISL